MKNLFYLIALFSINSMFSQNSKTIIGEWDASDFWKNKSKFIFSEDGYISMTTNGELVDGRNFIIKGGNDNGKKSEIKYTIDYTKNPIEIDIIASKNEHGSAVERGRMLCILKFIDDNEAQLLISRGKRESEFNDENKDRIMNLSKNN